MQSLVTTSQNDNGATARRQYVWFGEFISGQRSEFQIFEIAISIASFQNPPRSIVLASKNDVCMFFYIQIPISEYRETHGRKKIETHPNTRRKPAFSASIAAFRALRAFRACIRAYYELFFLEESSVNPRCARGPSLSKLAGILMPRALVTIGLKSLRALNVLLILNSFVA